MKTVLFLCSHNSARSQIAEGLLRSLGGNKFEVYSAGLEKTFVRPQAIQVMQEIGIDISKQTSKTLAQYLNNRFDEVITVCDQADKACPIFPNAKNRRHWSFPDPSRAAGSEIEILAVYRKVRDAIKTRIESELFK
jgi:arsenate reductase